MSILSRRSLIGLCFAPLLVPAIVNAGAIDVPQQGARASGQAEAFAAQADDPSAIWHNPAGLTQLHGTYLQDGGTLVLPFWKFESANGAGSQTMRMPSILPQIYLVSDLGTENLRVGLGANNVFGLNEDWKNDGPLTSIVTQAHLFCYNIAPSVAYQINPHLSLGLDLNVYWGDLELTRRVPLGPGMQDGTFHFRGQDAAVGATPAVMWKIDERNTIGAVYRSPFEFAFTGKARLKMNEAPEVGPSHSHVKMRLPQMATLAYAFRPIQP
ncbi:MAG TPA: outer membrane protein transport protein, partial [Tepidisphaeraceae bacterium]